MLTRSEKKAECEFDIEKSADWSRCRGGSRTSGVSLPQVVKKVQGRVCNESAFYYYFFVSLFCLVFFS